METPHWDACTMDPHQWMRFIECHPGFAGYVQAAGVIATIAAAIFGPPAKLAYDRWMRARARRRNTLETAWWFLSQVEEVVAAFDQRLARLRDPAVISEPDWMKFQEELGLVIPMALEIRFVDANSVDVGRLAFTELLPDAMRAWNTRTFENRTKPGFGTDAWREMVADMTARATKVRAVAVETKAQIEAMGKRPRRKK